MKLKLKSKEDERSDKNENDIEFIVNNLQIDKFKLDEEACKQIELLDRISRILPKSREVTLRAKNRLEIVESEISKDIRKNPKQYGLDKTSDAVVSREVKTQPEYKKAFSGYLFAKTKEDQYQILLNNIQERGRMIKILVELHLNNYYSDSSQYITKKRKPLKVSEE